MLLIPVKERINALICRRNCFKNPSGSERSLTLYLNDNVTFQLFHKKIIYAETSFKEMFSSLLKFSYSSNRGKSIISKIVLIIILSIIHNTSFSQPAKDRMLKMIPTTPEAYSITKYGNYPVSNYTGIPNIGIPLYNIEVDKLNIPIQINYHGGGNKVNELVSSIGLGWSLSAGGVISRTVMGVPDEQTPQGSFYSEIKHEDDANPEYLEEVAKRDKDGEPDIFSYSFLGYNGKFVFGKNKEILTVPYTDLKVNFDNNIFTLTDNLGRTYVFEEKSRNSSFSEATSAKYFAPTSWHLTKIILENKTDVITISYKQYNLGNIPTIDYSLSVGWLPYGQIGSNGTGASINYAKTETIYPTKTVFYENPDEHYPQEISFPNGKVSFIYKEGRLDYGRVTLDSIIISNSNHEAIKKIAFNHDYFFSEAGYNAYAASMDKYRLKLNGVRYTDKTSSKVFSEYKFAYEEGYKLPPRNNCGVDWWGYSNGQIYNEHLISLDEKGKEYEYYDGVHLKMTTSIYHPANREPDENNMRAGILKRIYYPTGGYTDFDFEPNKVNVSSLADPKEISFMAVGDKEAGKPDEVEFTPTITTQNATLRVNIPLWQDTKKPYAEFRNLTTGTNMRFVAFPGDPRFQTITVPLTAGQNYKLIASISPNPSDPKDDTDERVLITISWAGDPTEMIVKEQKGPGLRIKSIKNYTSADVLASHEEYKYGKNETGVGQSRFFDYLLRRRTYVQKYIHTEYSINVPEKFLFFDASTLEILSRPIYEYSSGAYLIAYPEVAKYQYSANGDNGKSVYNYDFEMDDLLEVNVPDPQSLLSLSWKTGNLLSEQHFRREFNGSYTPLTESINKYNLVNIQTDFGLKVSRKAVKVGSFLAPPNRDQYYYFDYPIISGVNKLESTEFKSYNPSGIVSTNKKMLYLNDKNLQPRIVKTSKSSGDEEVTYTTYPEDYPQGTLFIDDMRRNNLLAYPIENTRYTESGNQSSILSGSIIRYLSGGKGLIDTVYQIEASTSIPLSGFKFSNHLAGELPTAINNSPFSAHSSYKPVVSYGNNYNSNSKPLLITPYMGPPTSYLWNYGDQKVVAIVQNAFQTDIAYTSFEAEGKGNWTFSGTANVSGTAATGNMVYQLSSGALSKSGLTIGKTYILSYRTKNTVPFTVAGTVGTATSVALSGGWTLYEHQITGIATIQLAGAGIIDEVRLYPSDASMSTYTYAPMVGTTTQTDPKGQTTYYEYDESQRLKNVKDQNGNIIKNSTYNYKP